MDQKKGSDYLKGHEEEGVPEDKVRVPCLPTFLSSTHTNKRPQRRRRTKGQSILFLFLSYQPSMHTNKRLPAKPQRRRRTRGQSKGTLYTYLPTYPTLPWTWIKDYLQGHEEEGVPEDRIRRIPALPTLPFPTLA